MYRYQLPADVDAQSSKGKLQKLSLVELQPASRLQADVAPFKPPRNAPRHDYHLPPTPLQSLPKHQCPIISHNDTSLARHARTIGHAIGKPQGKLRKDLLYVDK
jgi:hypothetical protein